MKRFERKRSLVGIITAMAVVNLVYGITFPLLALVLDAQGVSKTLIGLSTIVQASAVSRPWAGRSTGREASGPMEGFSAGADNHVGQCGLCSKR